MRLAILFALNALSAPYANLVHDAQLYAFQVLNRAHDGAFASDLFLKYGSQDQYTPFSWLVAPLARLLGVEWTFFLLFLASNALVVLALDVLIRALVADRRWSTAATMFAALSSMPYAGLSVLFIREGFFTPRMTATAVALLALGMVLRTRRAGALVLAAIATGIHPLMGAPALIVVLGVLAANHVGVRAGTVALGMTAVVGGAVLVWRPLAYALFGAMDADWLALVRHASPYVVLEGWAAADWTRLLAALATVLGAGFVMRGDQRGAGAMFLGAAAGAMAGLIATAVATNAGYRLLVQAQPYRAVWLVHLLHIPAVALLIPALWRRGGWHAVLAAGALCTLILVDFVVYEFVFAALVLGVLVLRDVRLRSKGAWCALAQALVISVLTASALWGALKLGFAVHQADDILKVVEVPLFLKTMASYVPRIVWFGLLLAAIAWMLRRLQPRTVLVTSIAVAALPHALGFAVHAVPALRQWAEPHARDVAFVRHFIAARYESRDRPPTVYAGPWGDLGLVWLGLRAQNYFATVVVIFNRETAFETLRRARLVRSFELERYRDIGYMVPAVARPLVAYLFEPQRPAGPPARADLERLCNSSEGVDVAVLSGDYDGLASARNERVFVYECRRLRGAGGSVSGFAGQARHL